MNRDERLVQLLKQRDPAAFKTVVNAHKDRVFNTCLGFLQHPEDAEDLSQEVFMQLYESIDDFRGEASLTTWIYRIAVTKSLELLRRRKRLKRRAFFLSRNSQADPDRLEGDAPFTHPGIALENKERAQILFREIRKLGEQQKTAFLLHNVEGLRYKEVAEVMEISLPAVESLIHRARKNLRKQLHDYYTNQNP